VYGVDGEHRFAEFGVQFVKDRLAESNGDVMDDAGNRTANSIALLADFTDVGFHLFSGSFIWATYRIAFNFRKSRSW
jgi:hypothetical protein